MSFLKDFATEFSITGVTSVLANLCWIGIGVAAKTIYDWAVKKSKKKMLATVLECKKHDEAILFIPTRVGSVIKNYTDYLVITEESSIVPRMQRIAEELSISMKVSQMPKDEESYDERVSGWFFGGYMVHSYVEKFFINVLQEDLRFSTVSLAKHGKEKCLYFEYKEPKQIFLRCNERTQNKLDEICENSGKHANWKRRIRTCPDNGRYLSLQCEDNERFYFLIRFKNSRGKSVNICFGATADVNLRLARMLDEERSWLYHKVKDHSDGYILLGKVDLNRKEIIWDNVIDLTWMFEDKLKSVKI